MDSRKQLRTCTLIVLWYSLIAIGMLWSSSAARADTVRITAGITSFSGLAISFGPNSAGTYITINPSTTCPTGANCTDPRFGFDALCPDTGCGTGAGMATNMPLDVPNDPGVTNVVFKVASSQTSETPSAIAFTPSGLLSGVNIAGEFKLGIAAGDLISWRPQSIAARSEFENEALQNSIGAVCVATCRMQALRQ